MTDATATPAADAAELTPAERARRRRRTWLILASISVGWKVLVFTLGAALPRWFVSDGLAEIAPEHRRYAEQAMATARTLWNGPIERHGVVRSVRVMAAGAQAGAGDECGNMTARVRAYTYFAIPYSEVRLVCAEGVVEYRVFRRKRRHAG